MDLCLHECPLLGAGILRDKDILSRRIQESNERCSLAGFYLSLECELVLQCCTRSHLEWTLGCVIDSIPV